MLMLAQNISEVNRLRNCPKEINFAPASYTGPPFLKPLNFDNGHGCSKAPAPLSAGLSFESPRRKLISVKSRYILLTIPAICIKMLFVYLCSYARGVLIMKIKDWFIGDTSKTSVQFFRSLFVGGIATIADMVIT